MVNQLDKNVLLRSGISKAETRNRLGPLNKMLRTDWWRVPLIERAREFRSTHDGGLQSFVFECEVLASTRPRIDPGGMLRSISWFACDNEPVSLSPSIALIQYFKDGPPRRLCLWPKRQCRQASGQCRWIDTNHSWQQCCDS